MRILVKAAPMIRRLELASLICMSHGHRACTLDQKRDREHRAFRDRMAAENPYSFWGPMIIREYGGRHYRQADAFRKQRDLAIKAKTWIEVDEDELAALADCITAGFAKHPTNAELWPELVESGND